MAAMLLAAIPCSGEPAGMSSRDRLVIVSPAAWTAALAPLVALREKALDVEAVALEDVLEKGEGVDAPERIKRFLWRGWKERRVRYALLVGDADTFPVRFMVLDRVTAPAFDTAFYGSDLYYADVARPDGSFDDWNAKKDGFHARYYGDAWNAAVAHYYDAEHLSTLAATPDWYPASIFFQAMKFVLLGDPSLPMP